jgi:hypothetical protein
MSDSVLTSISRQDKQRLSSALSRFIERRMGYYQQWIYDRPVVLSASMDADFERLHGLMLRVIKEFVTHYQVYADLMPVGERTRAILDLFNEHPFSPGTFRTDYVFDGSGQAKLIEITCRFALNGLFEGVMYRRYAEELFRVTHPDVPVANREGGLCSYLESLCAGSEEIWLLRGEEDRNSSRHFVGMFEDAGYRVRVVHPAELLGRSEGLHGAWVISELNLDEIHALPDEALRLLAQSHLINDFRTVLLVHDKRFFAAMQDPELQTACLTEEEQAFFNRFVIATHRFGQAPEAWSDALEHPERWFLKHRALGKSESVYSGLELGVEAWRKVMAEADLSEFVLQEFVPQKRWKGQIHGEEIEEYVTGTLLYVNDHYFGQGPFRTSTSLSMKSEVKRNVGVLACAQPGELPPEGLYAFLK